MAQYVDGFAIALPKNKIATLSPEEEAEFERLMIQARSDAFALGISQGPASKSWEFPAAKN